MYVFFWNRGKIAHMFIIIYNLSPPSSFMMPQQLPLALAAVVVVLLNFIRRLCDDKEYNLTTLGQQI